MGETEHSTNGVTVKCPRCDLHLFTVANTSTENGIKEISSNLIMNNEFITRQFLSAMNSSGKPESSKEVQQEVEVEADVTADHNVQPNIATSYVSRSFENVPCPAPHWRKSKVAQIFRRNSRREQGQSRTKSQNLQSHNS